MVERVVSQFMHFKKILYSLGLFVSSRDAT